MTRRGSGVGPLVFLAILGGWGIGTEQGRGAMGGLFGARPAAAESAPTATGARAVAAARRQLGKPYVFGADGPGAFDCSGLAIHGAWRPAGADWPDATADDLGHHFPATRTPRPGDLGLWDWDGDGRWDHVALYAGRGRIIEAPRRGVPVREVALVATGNGPAAWRRPSARW